MRTRLQLLPFIALVVIALAQPAQAHDAASSRGAERHHHGRVVAGSDHRWARWPRYRRVYAAAEPLWVSEPDCIDGVLAPVASAAPGTRWRQIAEPFECVAPSRHYYWSAAQWRYFLHHPSAVSDWIGYTLGY